MAIEIDQSVDAYIETMAREERKRELRSAYRSRASQRARGFAKPIEFASAGNERSGRAILLVAGLPARPMISVPDGGFGEIQQAKSSSEG